MLDASELTLEHLDIAAGLSLPPPMVASHQGCEALDVFQVESVCQHGDLKCDIAEDPIFHCAKGSKTVIVRGYGSN